MSRTVLLVPENLVEPHRTEMVCVYTCPGVHSLRDLRFSKVSFHSLGYILGSLCSRKVLVLICLYHLLFDLVSGVVEYNSN
jgi:hypothetical protein